MGLGSISLTQLLIIMVIVVLLFGTKKLGNIGEDLGKAIKGFKKAVSEPENDTAKALEQQQQTPIEGTAQVKKEEVK